MSDSRMIRAIAKLQKNKLLGDDDREKSTESRRRLPAASTDVVIQHINRFPAYESHYARKHNSNRNCLYPNLNVKRRMISTLKAAHRRI